METTVKSKRYDAAEPRMVEGALFACARASAHVRGGVQPTGPAKSHFHNYFELYYLEEGKRSLVLNDSVLSIRAGECIIFAPYVMHHSFGEENSFYRRIVLYFDPCVLQSKELQDMLQNGIGVYRPDAALQKEIIKLLEDIMTEEAEPGLLYGDYQTGLINMLVLKVIRGAHVTEKVKKRDRILDIMNDIHLHYNEDIDLDELAERFYISRYHLCREFKRVTGKTLVQYINAIRIKNAKWELVNSEKNVTDIGIDVGFSNATHFYRIFRDQTGVSPSEYRKRHLNKEA